MDFIMEQNWFDYTYHFISIISAIATIYLLYKILSYRVQKRRALEKVRKKSLIIKGIQSKLEEKLEKLKHSSTWDDILKTSFDDLSRKLRSGELSSIDTLHAYQWKAIQVNKKQNCVTQFLEDAELESKKCDEIPIKDRKPLHGLPVSIKECFHVRGCDSTSGLTQFLFKPNDKDGLTVELLRKNGAIPFCMTNVPQTMMGYQCSNPCFGASGNPYDPEREVGGSSGGEGSLIGGGGSILGVGSDIGGSLRCPAALCGIASLRPTKGRDISLLGCHSGNISHISPATIQCVSGFMSSSVSGLVKSYKTMYDDEELARKDKEIIPMKWKHDVFDSNRKLRVGYCTSDGFYQPHPGCERAVVQAVELISKLGHEPIKFEPPNMNEVSRLFMGKIMADKLKYLNETLTYGNIIDTSMNGIVRFIFLLNWIPTWILSYVLNPLMSLFTKTQFFPVFETSAELWNGTTERDNFVQNYLEKMNESDIDLLIFPASLVPAPKKDYYFFQKVPTAGSPWITWNLFDFPAGILPMTNVKEEDEKKLNSSYPTNDLVYRYIKEGSKNSVGMPLAVQVVGRRYNEELILRLMKEMESITEFRNIN